MDPGGSRLGKLKIGQLELYTFLARSSDSFAVANEKLWISPHKSTVWEHSFYGKRKQLRRKKIERMVKMVIH